MSQPGWLGSLRVAALYMAGVILGCLGATCVEPTKYLLGASAGVYALILAHLGNLNSTAQTAKSGDFEAAASPAASANCYYGNTCYFESSS